MKIGLDIEGTMAISDLFLYNPKQYKNYPPPDLLIRFIF